MHVFDPYLVVEFFDEVGFQLRPLRCRRCVLSPNVEFSPIVVENIEFWRDYPDPWTLRRHYATSKPLLQFAVLLLFEVLEVLGLCEHGLEVLLLLRVHVLDEARVNILPDQVHAILLLLQRPQILKYFLSPLLEDADVLLGDGALLRGLPLLPVLLLLGLSGELLCQKQGAGIGHRVGQGQDATTTVTLVRRDYRVFEVLREHWSL